jgi:DNA-binding response OmpR family regulator
MVMKPSILFVDDNPEMCELVRTGLERDGYAVTSTSSAQEFLEKLTFIRPDAILLDLVLSDENGLNLISKIREQTNAPVIVVSGKSDLVDKVVGLEMGADDYVSKPFQMKELSTRIKAQLRRYQSLAPENRANAKTEQIPFGKWVLDRARLQIFNKDKESGDLTVKEFRLLEALILCPNQVLSRDQLLEKSRSHDMNVTDRAIDTQIARIRKKIGDDGSGPQLIQSIRGIGYIFVP